MALNEDVTDSSALDARLRSTRVTWIGQCARAGPDIVSHAPQSPAGDAAPARHGTEKLPTQASKAATRSRPATEIRSASTPLDAGPSSRARTGDGAAVTTDNAAVALPSHARDVDARPTTTTAPPEPTEIRPPTAQWGMRLRKTKTTWEFGRATWDGPSVSGKASSKVVGARLRRDTSNIKPTTKAVGA